MNETLAETNLRRRLFIFDYYTISSADQNHRNSHALTT